MSTLLKSLSLVLIFVHGCFFSAFAQTAENNRAKSWLALQQLLYKKVAAPWNLTTVELHILDSASTTTALTPCTGVLQISCSVAAALPVQELKLKGQRLNAQKVQLNWETIGEYNSHIFVIERQTSIPNQFDSVGVLPAAGTSYGKLKYEAVDINSYINNSFYRIKEVDIDGKYMYSNIVRVNGIPGLFEVNVVPNPAGSTNLRFYFVSTAASQTIDFTVINSNGMLLIKKEKFTISTGYYQVPAYQHLPPGFYIIEVRTSDNVYTKKFEVVD
jgi:hypothetical protein